MRLHISPRAWSLKGGCSKPAKPQYRSTFAVEEVLFEEALFAAELPVLSPGRGSQPSSSSDAQASELPRDSQYLSRSVNTSVSRRAREAREERYYSLMMSPAWIDNPCMEKDPCVFGSPKPKTFTLFEPVPPSKAVVRRGKGSTPSTRSVGIPGAQWVLPLGEPPPDGARSSSSSQPRPALSKGSSGRGADHSCWLCRLVGETGCETGRCQFDLGGAFIREIDVASSVAEPQPRISFERSGSPRTGSPRRPATRELACDSFSIPQALKIKQRDWCSVDPRTHLSTRDAGALNKVSKMSLEPRPGPRRPPDVRKKNMCKPPARAPEYAKMLLNPHKVMFVRDTIFHQFSCGRTLEATIEELRNGELSVEQIPLMTVARVRNGGSHLGTFVAIDHRRLHVFREAFPDSEETPVEIPVRLLVSDWAVRERLPQVFSPVDSVTVSDDPSCVPQTAQGPRVLHGVPSELLQPWDDAACET